MAQPRKSISLDKIPILSLLMSWQRINLMIWQLVHTPPTLPVLQLWFITELPRSHKTGSSLCKLQPSWHTSCELCYVTHQFRTLLCCIKTLTCIKWYLFVDTEMKTFSGLLVECYKTLYLWSTLLLHINVMDGSRNILMCLNTITRKYILWLCRRVVWTWKLLHWLI